MAASRAKKKPKKKCYVRNNGRKRVVPCKKRRKKAPPRKPQPGAVREPAPARVPSAAPAAPAVAAPVPVDLPTSPAPVPAVPTTPPGAGGPVPTVPEPPPLPPSFHDLRTPIAVFSGRFGPRQAERLLWRAGFGPRPGEAEALAEKGLENAVLSLTRPAGEAVLTGPEPAVGSPAGPLAPTDRTGHDHLFWLDRMVRSSHPLVERLALVFHDWFATSNAGVESQKLMLEQTNLFRSHGLGSFRTLVSAVTQDPAMIRWLNQDQNRKGSINENFARELMELFALGADRGAYTEGDIRELARALSGWRASWTAELGFYNFRWDPTRWDAGIKTVFGQSGAFKWDDAVRLVIDHPMHASFFVRKLWSYFVGAPPPDDVAAALEQRYVESGHDVRAVLEAILVSPWFYEGPAMVKPPVVWVAGMLRRLGRGIDTDQWWHMCQGAGQRLYYPPDVSGWNDAAWLDTNTVLGRWTLVVRMIVGHTVAGTDWSKYPAETATEAVTKAIAFWGDPPLEPATVAALEAWATACVPFAPTPQLRAQRQNALRQVLAASPDYQTC